MRITADLFRSYGINWRIQISPPRNGTTISRISENRNGMETLVFNPIVSIVAGSTHQGGGYCMIPINVTYLLCDVVEALYAGLGTKGLYKKDGSRLYMDQKIAEGLTRKVSCYRTSLVIQPVIIETSGDDAMGLQFSSEGSVIGTMRFDEVRSFCETLSHLDVSTFTMVAELAVQLGVMDRKLDRIAETNAQILQLLRTQGLSVQKRSATSDFIWQPVQ